MSYDDLQVPAATAKQRPGDPRLRRPKKPEKREKVKTSGSKRGRKQMPHTGETVKTCFSMKKGKKAWLAKYARMHGLCQSVALDEILEEGIKAMALASRRRSK